MYILCCLQVCLGFSEVIKRLQIVIKPLPVAVQVNAASIFAGYKKTGA